MAEPFKPQLRLIIQASIPIANGAQGEEEYENLKIFLLAISPDITLNGQIMKMLEPCCQKKPEPKNYENRPPFS